MLEDYLSNQWSMAENDVLDHDEINRLIAIAQDGYDYNKKEWVTEAAIEARDKVILANVRMAPLAVNNVLKYNKHLFLSCINECYMSFEKAITRYKVGSKVGFHHFAKKSAQYELMTFLEEEKNTIRLPILHKNKDQYKTLSIDNHFDSGTNESPMMMFLKNEVGSLADINKRELTELINKALATLTEREQVILKTIYLGEKKQARELVAKSLGVSQQRISQIEARSLRKLKSFIKELENIDNYATV